MKRRIITTDLQTDVAVTTLALGAVAVCAVLPSCLLGKYQQRICARARLLPDREPAVLLPVIRHTVQGCRPTHL
jgi:hypothetical protein